MTQDIENTHGEDVTVTIKTETTVQTDEVTNASSSPVENGADTPDDFDNGVAIRPNSAEDIPDLLKKVGSLGAEYASNTDEDLRAEYLDAARHLVYALETPREAMIRYCWSQVLHSLSRSDRTRPGWTNVCRAHSMLRSKHVSTSACSRFCPRTTLPRQRMSSQRLPMPNLSFSVCLTVQFVVLANEA